MSNTPEHDAQQYDCHPGGGLHSIVVVLATSVTAALAGLVALYFVYAERWGDGFIRRLSGEENINLLFWEGRLITQFHLLK